MGPCGSHRQLAFACSQRWVFNSTPQSPPITALALKWYIVPQHSVADWLDTFYFSSSYLNHQEWQIKLSSRWQLGSLLSASVCGISYAALSLKKERHSVFVKRSLQFVVLGEKGPLLLPRLCFPSWLCQLPYRLDPQFRTTTQSNEVYKFTNHGHKRGGQLKWSNLLSGS